MSDLGSEPCPVGFIELEYGRKDLWTRTHATTDADGLATLQLTAGPTVARGFACGRDLRFEVDGTDLYELTFRLPARTARPVLPRLSEPPPHAAPRPAPCRFEVTSVAGDYRDLRRAADDCAILATDRDGHRVRITPDGAVSPTTDEPAAPASGDVRIEFLPRVPERLDGIGPSDLYDAVLVDPTTGARHLVAEGVTNNVAIGRTVLVFREAAQGGLGRFIVVRLDHPTEPTAIGTWQDHVGSISDDGRWLTTHGGSHKGIPANETIQRFDGRGRGIDVGSDRGQWIGDRAAFVTLERDGYVFEELDAGVARATPFPQLHLYEPELRRERVLAKHVQSFVALDDGQVLYSAIGGGLSVVRLDVEGD